MGMYDHVHAGNRCGQTKAFASLLCDYRIGDEVPEVAPGGDVQIAMNAGGWLVVRGGRLAEWTDEPVAGLRAVASTGVPLPEGDIRPYGIRDAGYPDDIGDPGGCEICHELRRGRLRAV